MTQCAKTASCIPQAPAGEVSLEGTAHSNTNPVCIRSFTPSCMVVNARSLATFQTLQDPEGVCLMKDTMISYEKECQLGK